MCVCLLVTRFIVCGRFWALHVRPPTLHPTPSISILFYSLKFACLVAKPTSYSLDWWGCWIDGSGRGARYRHRRSNPRERRVIESLRCVVQPNSLSQPVGCGRRAGLMDKFLRWLRPDRLKQQSETSFLGASIFHLLCLRDSYCYYPLLCI